MPEVAATRSAALELTDERRLMRQGYEFLDEKRVLLAAEMLRQLRALEARSAAFRDELTAAAAALAAAVERHGLEHLLVYPASPTPPARTRDRRVFLGIPLLEVRSAAEAAVEEPAAIDPSPEAKACRASFERLLHSAAEIGARAGNLRRLAREYRRTERRAKALENVLLPEVEGAIKYVEELLETMDRDDAVRARWSASKLDRRRESGGG